MIPAIRGQLHACRRKAGPHYNLIGGFAIMGAGVGVGGGTYATTGRDAKIVKQVAPLAMARGLFAVTGGNAALDGPGAKNLAPSTGTFALSGRNAALGAGLPANSGTFALTGKPAGMTIGGAGRFALTGNAAIMAAAAPLGAGAFTMGGVAARLASGDSLTGTSGTYALTGRNAVLGAGLRTGAGSFALTGNAANEHYGYNLPSVSGTFALTGRAATMVTGTHGIGGGTGTFTLTGNAAILGAGLSAASASFALTGRSAVLADGRNTHVNAGTYSLTGNAAALSRRLLLNSGTFALTGRAASMADALGAGSGTFALTGTATAMNVELHPVTGAFALTGNAAAMTGQTVTLNPADKSADITLSSGNLGFSGTTTPNHNYNVRGTQAGAAGRYFEVTFSTIPFNSFGTTPGVGVANLSQSLSSYPGDPNGVGAFANTYIEWPGSGYSNVTSSAFGAGDVLGVYRRTSSVEFFKNGSIIGTATTLPSGALYPIISPGTNGDTGTVNFGATALSYLPLGATSWDGSQTNTDTGAHSGSFVLTGRAALLGDNLPAASGTFTLTGRAAVMGESLGATGIGNYAVTGNAAVMATGVPASSGSFAMTGRAVVTASGHGLAANSSSFSMTGNAAGMVLVAANSMNPADANPSGELSFTNSNLTVTHESSTNTYSGVRALLGWTTGKHYAEIHIDNYGNGGQIALGLMDKSSADVTASGVGGDSHGAMWYSNGYAGYNNAFVQLTSPGGTNPGFGQLDTLMVAYDADLKRVYFGKDGTWQGPSGGSDPAAGTGYVDMSSPGPTGAVYLTLLMGQSDVLTAHFSSTSFTYTPPTGFN
jgi:hypothetical protein